MVNPEAVVLRRSCSLGAATLAVAELVTLALRTWIMKVIPGALQPYKPSTLHTLCHVGPTCSRRSHLL